MTAFADLDGTDGATWADAVLGPAVRSRLLDATVNGFYFQSLRDSGAPLAAAVAGFGVSGASTVTVPGGLARLTDELARRLDVRPRHPVVRVQRHADRVRVHLGSGEELDADRVVLAVPGPVSATLLADADDLERRLTATPYSSGLVGTLRFDRPLAAARLAGAYGVLVDPREETDVAALAVASRAGSGGISGEGTGREASNAGDVVTVMTTHDAARRWAAEPDERVGRRLVEALHGVDPRLPAPGSVTVTRWPAAMPTVPPGQARLVAAYRDVAPSRRVVLAGDYLGLPWTDSAAATGRWAGRAVLSTP
ncbi:FAD-dependent oxidoreductase [Thalassiella azotivora]